MEKTEETEENMPNPMTITPMEANIGRVTARLVTAHRLIAKVQEVEVARDVVLTLEELTEIVHATFGCGCAIVTSLRFLGVLDDQGRENFPPVKPPNMGPEAYRELDELVALVLDKREGPN